MGWSNVGATVVEAVTVIITTGTANSGIFVYNGAPATGNLIGSPVPKSGGKLEVTALLAPTIRPGKVFGVESEDYSGLYTAEDVSFKGDTHGQSWYVVAVGVAR